MHLSLKNNYVTFTLGNTPYNRPQPEKRIYFHDIPQDEAVLPSEETDIEIEPSEVTKILSNCSDNEKKKIEFLEKVYNAGPNRSLPYSSLLIEIETPTKNTVLHIAARYGNDKIVSLVVEHAPKLLFEFNENKESALHIAARGGHISIVEKLLAVYANFERQDIKTAWLEYTKRLENHVEKSDREELLNFVALGNVEGNTMFHEAMLCRKKKRIGGDKIFKACELYKTGDLSSKWNEIAFTNVNNAKQSVLYLAVDSEDKEAVGVIMANCPDNAKPEGLSPAVAAIMKKNKEMLRVILEKHQSWIHSTDTDERLPLHYAASIGYLEGVVHLLGICNFKCCPNQRDKHGYFSIHLASHGGHVDVVKKLLKYCPDPTEMLDTSHKRNILHVAAKSGKHKVVKHILHQSHRVPYLDGMINQKDNKGDTPLHLAAKWCHPKAVFYLTWDERVDLHLVNKNNQTAVEVINASSQLHDSPAREQLTRIALNSAGAKPRFRRLVHDKARQSDSNSPQLEKSTAESSGTKQQKQEGVLKSNKNQEPSDPKLNENKENVNSNNDEQYFFLTGSDEQFKDRVETLTLVSTLIITASVAACFAVPGEAEGKANNLCHAMFQVFVIFITISLFSSISSTIILFWAKLGFPELVPFCLKIVTPLLGIALVSLSLAFMAGLYTVISELTWLANVFMVGASILVVVVFLLYIVLFFPSSSTKISMRLISYYPFLFLAYLAEDHN